MLQRSKEQGKGREKERRNRKKRKYGQAKLKHAKRGITSCILSAVVLVTLAILLIVAYYSGGTAAPVIGGVGLVTLIIAICGLYLGIRGFKEREKDYLTCKIGTILSSLLILGFIMIFFRGLF